MLASNKTTIPFPSRYRGTEFLFRNWGIFAFLVFFELIMIASGRLLTTIWPALSEILISTTAMLAGMGIMLGMPVYAIYRLRTTHPLGHREHLEMITLWPWKSENRLPWGSPQLTWEDLLFFVTFWFSGVIALLGIARVSLSSVDSLRAARIPGYLLVGCVSWFSVSRSIAVLVCLWNTSPRWGWAMLFLIPLQIRLSLETLFQAMQSTPTGLIAALLILAIALSVIQEFVIRDSLKRLSELLRSTDLLQAADWHPRMLEKLGVPSFHVGTVRQQIGWFFKRLSPNESVPGISLASAFALSAWAGWLVFLTEPLRDDHYEIQAFQGFVVVITIMLAIIRWFTYFPGWPDPWSRWSLRQWIIPREDRALIVPICLVLVGVLGRRFIAPSLDSTWMLPLWVMSIVFTAFGCGHTAREQRLTTTIALTVPLSREPDVKPPLRSQAHRNRSS